LAVLPPRLAPELEEVTAYLLDQPNQIAAYHIPWADAIKVQHPECNAENVSQILRHALGEVFTQVLTHAGVFKRDQTGQAAFARFIATL